MFERDMDLLKSKSIQITILSNLYNGEILADVLAVQRINPGALAFYREKDISFDAAIRKAQATQIDAKVDSLIHIADHYDDPRMASVISENIKWIAERRYREIYGARMDMNVNQVIDIQDVLSMAKKRVIDFHGAKQLEYIDNATDNISVQRRIAVRPDDQDPFS